MSTKEAKGERKRERERDRQRLKEEQTMTMNDEQGYGGTHRRQTYNHTDERKDRRLSRVKDEQLGKHHRQADADAVYIGQPRAESVRMRVAGHTGDKQTDAVTNTRERYIQALTTDAQRKGRTHSGTHNTERRGHRRRVGQTCSQAHNAPRRFSCNTDTETDIQTKGKQQTEGHSAQRRRDERARHTI